MVEAAKRVFERDGFLEARIVDIAEAADLAPGSFYHYFDKTCLVQIGTRRQIYLIDPIALLALRQDGSVWGAGNTLGESSEFAASGDFEWEAGFPKKKGKKK